MPDPIELSLRTEKQVALARLQDRVVEVLFELVPDVVMHGGTAIWRCYDGNRFSEDIDIYATDKQVDSLMKELTWMLSKRNVKLDYPKFNTRALAFSDDFARSTLGMMKLPARLTPVQKEYTRANGTKFAITTLSEQDFIIEKISTYQKRRYVRDLYDIYHLVNRVTTLGKARKALLAFLQSTEKPIDEEKLRDLIYAGVAPTFDTMITSVKGRLK
jgi:predicted nucleotidyltransferase component of viral defense system